MDFFIKCYIPSLKNDVNINKISFGDYFQLNSYFENNDLENANIIFEKICEKSLNCSKNICNLDKFSILIHLHSCYFSSILKLIGKDKESNKVNYEISLKHIIKEIKKYQFDEISLPKKLYYSNISDILNETNQNIEDIKKHIEKNKILMFECPDIIKNISKIYFNCFDNTLFHFLKLVYSTNLKILYKKIKILKKDYNFLLSEIYEMHPKEIEFFLSSK